MIGYLASNDGSVDRLDGMTGTAIMSNTGRNTGNLAFWYATRRLFADDIEPVSWSTKVHPKYKAIVIPAANFIGPHANLSPLIRVLECTDAPVVIVGLGAQSESESVMPKVPEATVRFLELVSARTPFMGIRGEYSGWVSEQLGIKNFRVLGCPSVLISPDKALGAKIEQRIRNLKPDTIAVAGASRKGNLTTVERELYRLVKMNPGSAYVVQRPPEFVSVLMREALDAGGEDYMRLFAEYLALPGGADDLKMFLLHNGYVPTSIDAWSSWIQRFSCAVNTRIHGTMVALQSGVPSLCVVHDTRTRELAKRCKLPMLEIKQFVENRYDIRKCFAETKFDGDAFDECRRAVAKEYVELFEAAGVTPSNHLLTLA